MFRLEPGVGKLMSNSNKNMLFTGENIKVFLATKVLNILSSNTELLNKYKGSLNLVLTQLESGGIDAGVIIKKMSGVYTQVKFDDGFITLNELTCSPSYPKITPIQKSNKSKSGTISKFLKNLDMLVGRDKKSSPQLKKGLEFTVRLTDNYTVNDYVNDLNKRFPIAIQFYLTLLDYIKSRRACNGNDDITTQFFSVISYYWLYDLIENEKELAGGLSEVFTRINYILPIQSRSIDWNSDYKSILKQNLIKKDKKSNLPKLSRKSDRNVGYIDSTIDSKVFLRAILEHFDNNESGAQDYLSNPLRIIRDLIFVISLTKGFMNNVDIRLVNNKCHIEYLVSGNKVNLPSDDKLLKHLEEINFTPLIDLVDIELFNKDSIDNFTTIDNWIKPNEPSEYIKTDYNLDIYTGDIAYKEFSPKQDLDLNGMTPAHKVTMIERILIEGFIDNISKRYNNETQKHISHYDNRYYHILFEEFKNDILGNPYYIQKDVTSFQKDNLKHLDSSDVIRTLFKKPLLFNDIYDLNKFNIKPNEDLLRKELLKESLSTRYREYKRKLFTQELLTERISQVKELVEKHCSALIQNMVNKLDFLNIKHKLNVDKLNNRNKSALVNSLKVNVTDYNFKSGIQFYQCFGRILELPIKIKLSDNAFLTNALFTLTKDGMYILIFYKENKTKIVMADDFIEDVLNSKLELTIEEDGLISEIIYNLRKE